MNDEEINHRSLALLGCLLAGLALTIPALLLYNGALELGSAYGLELPGWLQSCIGLAVALLPLVLLVRLAAGKLNLRYPETADRRVPEAHERPSAHKRR